MASAPPRRIEPPQLQSTLDAEGFHSRPWADYHQSVADRLFGLPAQVRRGVTDGSVAASGDIGEYLQVTGSVGLTSGAAANAAVLALSAGDWDVWGRAEFVPAGGTLSQGLIASASPNSNALSGVLMQLPYSAAAGGLASLPTGTLRLNLAADGAAYLVVYAVFSVSGMTCNGLLMARRVR